MCTGGLSCSYPPSPATLPLQVALVVKNMPANTKDIRDVGSIPGSGRSLGGGHGNPLQYSCLENPMGRGAWQATVHGVSQSQTRLSDLACTHACTHPSSLLADSGRLYWSLNTVARACARPGLFSCCSPACISHPHPQISPEALI